MQTEIESGNWCKSDRLFGACPLLFVASRNEHVIIAFIVMNKSKIVELIKDFEFIFQHLIDIL